VFLFPLALCGGLVLGVLTGGRLGALANVRVRVPYAVIGALAFQIAVSFPPLEHASHAARFAVLLTSYVVVGIWTVLNVPGRPITFQVGLVVTGIGWLLNTVAIAANGGMPVSASVLREIGIPRDVAVAPGNLSKHILESKASTLGFLGDTIPIGWLKTGVSVGDILFLIGLVVVVAALTHTSPPTDIAADGSPSAAAPPATGSSPACNSTTPAN
jgi:hypothetical protein